MIKKEKFISILEYVALIFIFLLSIKKGGYYKQDSVVCIFFLQIVIGIIMLISLRDRKKGSVLSILFLILAVSYFIPLLFNAATISGALNIFLRVATFVMIYLLVFNSTNKKKYINFIVAISIIISLFGIDELGRRYLNNVLGFLGSGYLDESTGALSSVIQYSNLVGILNVISIIYLVYLNIDSSVKKEEIYKPLRNTAIMFLTTCVFLTESKMCIVLLIISLLFVCVKNKEYKYLITIVLSTLYSFMLYFLCSVVSIYLLIFVGCVVFTIIEMILEQDKIKIKKEYVEIALSVVLVVAMINYAVFSNNHITERFEDYFKNFDSTLIRFEYYKDAVKILISSPKNFFFGIGGNGFRTMYETVQTTNYISLETHSMLMQVLVEAGIFGFGVMLSIIIYVLRRANNDRFKLMFLVLVIFASFDVFATYYYMMIVLVILSALCKLEEKTIGFYTKWHIIVLYLLVLGLNMLIFIAYTFEPIEVSNLNVSLEEQQDIIRQCEITLFFDPWDIMYREKYTNACITYLELLDIKKELYGQDDINKRKILVSKIYKNICKANRYEKENKYTIEDKIFYTCKYVDILVLDNYKDIEKGYIYYLKEILGELERLKNNHKNNDLATQMYEQEINNIKNKYNNVNLILNSQEITEIMETIT